MKVKPNELEINNLSSINKFFISDISKEFLTPPLKNQVSTLKLIDNFNIEINC